MKKFFSLFLVTFSVLCFSSVAFATTEEEVLAYDYISIIDDFVSRSDIDKNVYNRYLFFKFKSRSDSEVKNVFCLFFNENQSAYFDASYLHVLNPNNEIYYYYRIYADDEMDEINYSFNTKYLDFSISTLSLGVTDLQANFNISHTYTKDGVEITNSPTRNTYADNFFPVSPGGMATLPEIVTKLQEMTAEQMKIAEIMKVITITAVCCLTSLVVLAILSKVLAIFLA